jgi:hypothetical protein
MSSPNFSGGNPQKLGITGGAMQQRDSNPVELAARIQEMVEKSKEKRMSKMDGLPANVVRLPIWPDAVRGTPNAWLRGALFAAIQGKERRAFKRELLESVDGSELRFTGWQLDQSDFDVWETLIHMARDQAMGNRVEFTAHSILKALGRGTGKAQHEWLKDAFARLAGAVVEITVGKRTFFGALLKGARDEEIGHYVIELEPKLMAMYQAGWTGIDWDERQALRRKPLALWLHGWYCSHAKPYPLNVATIHRLSGSRNKSLADFRRQLVKALDDLKAIGAIGAWEMRGDIVDVIRKPTLSQQKHLNRKTRKLC